MILKPTTAYRIWDGQRACGHIIVTLQRDMTLHKLCALWEVDDDFDTWKLPPVFDYLWVDEVFVHPGHRRRGFASIALRKLMQTRKKPTLIALGPGDIDADNPVGYNALIKFYRGLGFYFQTFKDGQYAFNWTPGRHRT